MFQRSFQQATQSTLSREETLLSRQDTLINTKGPTLGQFAEPPDSLCIFLEEISFDKKTCWVRLKTDNNSNIRLFYYCMLCVCFEKECHKEGATYSNTILNNFKLQVYSDKLRLDRFNPDELDPQYREYYKDDVLKKVLVEFLQLMNYSDYGVLEMLRRYPIIDTIMVIAVRSLLGSATLKYTTVKTQLLADYLHNVIGLKIIKADKQYAFSGTRIAIIEEDLFSFAVKQEPFLKARRSSLANNLSSSDNRNKNELWQDIPETQFSKPVKPERVSRLTGLEYNETISKKATVPQRSKQLSMEPMMSLDLDHILVIPKQNNQNFFDEDKGILTIPKIPDKQQSITLTNKAQSIDLSQSVKSPNTYVQMPRMTEDPRLYLAVAKPTGSPSSSQLIYKVNEKEIPRYSELPKEQFYPKHQTLNREGSNIKLAEKLSLYKGSYAFPVLGSCQKTLDTEQLPNPKKGPNPNLGELTIPMDGLTSSKMISSPKAKLSQLNGKVADPPAPTKLPTRIKNLFETQQS